MGEEGLHKEGGGGHPCIRMGDNNANEERETVVGLVVFAGIKLHLHLLWDAG